MNNVGIMGYMTIRTIQIPKKRLNGPQLKKCYIYEKNIKYEWKYYYLQTLFSFFEKNTYLK